MYNDKALKKVMNFDYLGHGNKTALVLSEDSERYYCVDLEKNEPRCYLLNKMSSLQVLDSKIIDKGSLPHGHNLVSQFEESGYKVVDTEHYLVAYQKPFFITFQYNGVKFNNNNSFVLIFRDTLSTSPTLRKKLGSQAVLTVNNPSLDAIISALEQLAKT